jgi:spore coat protein A
MLQFQQKLHSSLPPTTLWGYEGQYPGPTIEALRDSPIEVDWQNQLPQQPLFPPDPRIHGAMPPTPPVRTVPHLHGSRTRSESDGLPEKWFTPGTSARYSYPNNQAAGTLWYHDHAVGITRLNVYSGLSGFYLLRDAEERQLGLPDGEYEIPLLLQDRMLDDAGQLVYAPTFDDGQKAQIAQWAPQMFGDLPVINGAIYPYLEVEPRAYRLRVLNGANSRYFSLFFNLAKRPTDIPSLVTFNQIGSDGGFLPKPAPLTKLLMGPAERADLIVDFSGLEGKTVTLSNNAATPYPGWGMIVPLYEPLDELMQFRVTRKKSPTGKAFTMPASFAFTKLDQTAAVTTRDFVLSETIDDQGHSLGVRINNRGYDDPLTESVKLGSTEKWRFINTTEDAHPMHLHLVQFQLVERHGYDTALFHRGILKLIGSPRLPAPYEAGWKDTVVVNPGEVVTIVVRFEGFTGRYVFHCHMLEHEDNDMMRPYEVIS